MIIHKIIKYKPHSNLPTVFRPGRVPGEFPYKAPPRQNQPAQVDHKSGLDWSGWVAGGTTKPSPPSVRNQQEYEAYLARNSYIKPGTLLVHRNTQNITTPLQLLMVLRIIQQYHDVRKFHTQTGNPYGIITASLSKVNLGTTSIPPAHTLEDCIDNYRTLTDKEIAEIVDDRVSNHIKAIKTYFGQQ